MKPGARHVGYFEVEEPILDLMERIAQLRGLASPDLEEEIEALERQVETLQRVIYDDLTPWEKTLMARHAMRPRFGDYLEALSDSYEYLRGDRIDQDDIAIQAALASINGRTWAVIGHNKGRTDEEAAQARYGMPLPSGFHKAMRVVRLAQRFGFPVLTLVDTPGPMQGIAGEQRGMAPIIARCLWTFATARTRTVSVITGEGGSGGAIALALTDRVYAQRNAVYSVISPEGCAAIIYRDAGRAPEAAERLKITASDLFDLEVVDGVIQEPMGGAHISPRKAAEMIRQEIVTAMDYLDSLPLETVLAERSERFRNLGAYGTGADTRYPKN